MRRVTHLDDARTSRRFLVGFALLLWAAAAPAATVEVQVSGVEGEVRDNVEARLSLRKAAQEKENDAAVLNRLHRRAPDEIREALQAMGYYQPSIQTEWLGQAPDFRSVIRIAPGPVTRLDVVDIKISGEGADEPSLKKTRDQLPLKLGDPLRHARYEQAKSELLRAAYQEGFLDAEMSRRWLLVRPESSTAEIELTLDTGPRYYFGELSLQQEELNDDFLRRYIDIQPGAAFDPNRLNQARFALTDLGYFSSLEVQARRAEAVDGHIPVTIIAVPAPRARYRAGIGYGTDTGARLSLGADFRRLNQYGHRLESNLQLSEIANKLQANYRIPLGSSVGEELSFFGEQSEEMIADLDTRKLTLGTALDRSPGDWDRKLYLRYEREEFSSQTENGSSKLLIPGINLSRTRIDDPVRARKGWSIFGDVHGAARNVLSDNGFLQGRVQARLVLPLWDKSRLLLRGELGGTIVEEFSQLPPSQRFFAGGDQSIRGYGYQSVGPRNAAGEVIGGEFLRTATVELETRLVGNWGAAVFIDAGGADNDPNTPIRRGVGAGVRWIAPVGTLRADLAHPLDGDRRGVRVHIGIRVGL